MAKMMLRNDKQLGRGRGNFGRGGSFGRGGGNTPGRGRGATTGRGTGKPVNTDVDTPDKGNASSKSANPVENTKKGKPATTANTPHKPNTTEASSNDMKMGRDNLRNLLQVFALGIGFMVDDKLLMILEEIGLSDDTTFMEYTCQPINLIFRNIFFSTAIREHGDADEDDMDHFEYTAEIVAAMIIIHEYFNELPDVERDHRRYINPVGYDTLIENGIPTTKDVCDFTMSRAGYVSDLLTNFKNISDRIVKGFYNKTDLVVKPDKSHKKDGKSSDRKSSKNTDKLTRTSDNKTLRQDKNKTKGSTQQNDG